MAGFLLLLGIGAIWLIFKAFEGVAEVGSDISSKVQAKGAFTAKRNLKYQDRVIDQSKSLYERNADIIVGFENKVVAHPPQPAASYSRYNRYRHYSTPKVYFIENLTRDCINEIAFAENNYSAYPGEKYLSNWKEHAPGEWVALAVQVESDFRERQAALIAKENQKQAQQEEIINMEKTLMARIAKRKDPILLRELYKRSGKGGVFIEDLGQVLTTNNTKWVDEITEYVSTKTRVNKFPLPNSEDKQYERVKERIESFNSSLAIDAKAEDENKTYFSKILNGYKKNTKESVISFIDYVVDSVELPKSMPKSWSIDFDPEQGIAIVEIGLPDVVHNPVFKKVELKSGVAKKPLNQKEIKESVPKIHPAIILKTAYEIYRNDSAGIIKLLVLNGWVEFNDPTTGNKARTYTASLVVEKKQITSLNLEKVEPVSAFTSLKGTSAGKLIDIIPITPVMSLDRKDKRFIETKEVLSKLGTQTNLASMDWQDFENLIAELFQREFSEEGTEIKLTQSSRDKGVDAVVFNPDPIRGGKYVIQAKRYTDTVGVSAVRDLVAVVAHEGASRGILVTTSTFGADAYAFVQNKPITLLDGAKLLGLLEKHGYKFKINLAEARKLSNLSPKSKQKVS